MKVRKTLKVSVYALLFAVAVYAGAWAGTIPGIEKCTSCKDGSFEYSVDGRAMTLTYKGEEPAKGELCAYLPLRYASGK